MKVRILGPSQTGMWGRVERIQEERFQSFFRKEDSKGRESEWSENIDEDTEPTIEDLNGEILETLMSAGHSTHKDRHRTDASRSAKWEREGFSNDVDMIFATKFLRGLVLTYKLKGSCFNLIGYLKAIFRNSAISTYSNQIEGKVEVKGGLITAIPSGPFLDKRRRWSQIGFMSRALPISFDYNITTRIQILESIEKQDHLKEKLENLKIPKKAKNIDLPFDMAKKLEPYALSLATAHSQYQRLYGFRYQRQLQTLAKSIAVLEGKDSVDDDCISELGRLANFINLNFSKV